MTRASKSQKLRGVIQHPQGVERGEVKETGGMIIRKLEYLIALAKAGHYGRAAEACHVSQPTLSRFAHICFPKSSAPTFPIISTRAPSRAAA